jgi:tetrahydromethanopterin S-methyltransferase subunit F
VIDKEEFNRQVRRTAFATVGFAAGLVFGIILLVTGD